MKKNYFSFVCFSFLFFVCAIAAISQPISQTFNVSGTYTVPAGYSASVTLEAWGAGGGGGTNSGNAKGGGGGGAYASTTLTLTAGSYTVTVGGGGAIATAGGNSSFAATVIAIGGGSTTTATGGAGGTAAASTGTIRQNGGNGGAGATTTGVRGGGGGGGSANPGSAGGNGGAGVAGAPGTGGAGGTGTGAGGNGADDDGTPDATTGTAPGGGGGGRGNNGNSQAGAAGRVIVTVNTVLPVRLKSFKAVKIGSAVQLEWNAETESNLADYSVEKSFDGRNFSAITSLQARNSAIPVTYTYSDAAATANVVYYRIAMVELDGKATFSRIIKVLSDSKGIPLQVYPNPVIGGAVSFTTPILAKGIYTVKVFNSNAQMIYQTKYTHTGGALSQSIQLPDGQRPGIYNIQVSDGQVKYQHNFLMQ